MLVDVGGAVHVAVGEIAHHQVEMRPIRGHERLHRAHAPVGERAADVALDVDGEIGLARRPRSAERVIGGAAAAYSSAPP